MTVISNHSTDNFNHRFPLVSWGAVFVGMLLALAFSVVMNVLGTAIGGTALMPMYERNLQAFGVGAGLWLVVTSIIATSVGAYFAGVCAPARGCMHGILTWAGALLVSVYLLSAVITGASSAALGVVGKSFSLAGQGMAGASSYIAKGAEKSGIDLDVSKLRKQVESTLQKSQGTRLDADKIKNQGAKLVDWVERVAQEGKPTLSNRDKDELTKMITSNTNRSRDEAKKIVDEIDRTYQQAVEKYQDVRQGAQKQMRKVATSAAVGVAQAAWWTFAMLVLGAVAAALAGHFGHRQQSQL